MKGSDRVYILLIVVLCLLGVGGFLLKIGYISRGREQITPKDIDGDRNWPAVSVLIPARNEEENIGRSLGSLVLQDYPKDKVEIIVVDDYSTDKTHEIVNEISKNSEIGVKCIMGRALPEGWLGKSNACMAGALEAKGDWIFFADADTYSEPEMLRSIIDFAIKNDTDLLSFNPKQEMVSLAEKLLLPGLFISVASSMRFDESNNPNKDTAIANGQAMLFRHSSYKEVGGHTVVANEISEDLAFAKAMKVRGYKIYWAFGDEIMSTRMYKNAVEIWHGFSKNMNRIMECRNKRDVAVSSLKSIALAWGTPVLFLLSLFSYLGEPTSYGLYALIIAGITQTALVVMYMVLASELHLSIIYALAVPFGITCQSMLIIKAYILSKQKAIKWKGRTIS